MKSSLSTSMSSRLKVLCVDDEPRVLEGLEVNLRAWDVVTVTSGDQALEAVSERGPFAVVVTDFRMPGMDGVTLLRKLRALSPDTIRILLTGQADHPRLKSVVDDVGLFCLLTKPCPPELLASTLDAAAKCFLEARRTP
jgi:CheY-like chemotaxis protein